MEVRNAKSNSRHRVLPCHALLELKCKFPFVTSKAHRHSMCSKCIRMYKLISSNSSLQTLFLGSSSHLPNAGRVFRDLPCSLAAIAVLTVTSLGISLAMEGNGSGLVISICRFLHCEINTVCETRTSHPVSWNGDNQPAQYVSWQCKTKLFISFMHSLPILSPSCPCISVPWACSVLAPPG